MFCSSGTEHLVMFYIDYTRPWILFELVPFVMLGVFGGLIGNIFIKANLRWCQHRKFSRLGQYPIWEVLAVTMVTAVVAFPNPYTRMNSSDLIKMMFSPCGIADETPLCDYYRNFTNVNDHVPIAQAGPGVYKSLGLLILALIFKLVITIFTFGIKVPAGLFIPSLAMGAIIGRIVGITMEQIAYNYPKWWFFQDACSNSGESCMSPGIHLWYFTTFVDIHCFLRSIRSGWRGRSSRRCDSNDHLFGSDNVRVDRFG